MSNPLDYFDGVATKKMKLFGRKVIIAEPDSFMLLHIPDKLRKLGVDPYSEEELQKVDSDIQLGIACEKVENALRFNVKRKYWLFGPRESRYTVQDVLSLPPSRVYALSVMVSTLQLLSESKNGKKKDPVEAGENPLDESLREP
jgi:hypothetical protein